jgi:hypothetical protein
MWAIGGAAQAGRVGINCNSASFNLDVNGSMRSSNLLINSAATANAFLNATTPSYGNYGNFAMNGYLSVVSAGTAVANVGAGNTYFSIPSDSGKAFYSNAYNTGFGIQTQNPSYTLDVNGVARAGIPVSSLTGTSATFGANAFGIYYYITNSAFSNIGLYNTSGGATGTGGTAPPIGTGWYVTLRNNTGSYLSITVNGLLASTPASPFTIPPSNSVTIAYDANLAGGAGYVFF